MTPCTLHEICQAVGGTLLQEGGGTVSGVTTDSREAGAGQLFVPLTGERFDGHDYIDAALARGAEGCLTMRRPAAMAEGKFYILVDDTLSALAALSGWHRARFSLPVVQVTGSVGKTTTKEMIASVLSQRFCTLKTEANYNNAIGTPQTLLRLTPAHQAAVIETGMNHFGEIRYLGRIVRPDVAVITNVGDAHIENLGGTRQGILQAKCEIFEHLRSGGAAVLNGDDELLSGLTLPFTTVLCGTSPRCHVRISDVVERGIEGVRCTVTTAADVYHLTIPSPGGYMAYPAAMAVAVGELLGLNGEEICRGVAAYASVGGRMRITRLAGGRIIIDDSYNANPQAMAEALKCLAQTPCRRRAAVLGNMGELGALAPEAHRAVGELTARYGIDEVVAVGDLAADICRGNEKAQWFASVSEAMPAIRGLFTEGTAVLVKASHAMHFGEIADTLREMKEL